MVGVVALAVALPVLIARGWSLAAWVVAVAFTTLLLGQQGMWLASIDSGELGVSGDALAYLSVLSALVIAEIASAWLARPAA